MAIFRRITRWRQTSPALLSPCQAPCPPGSMWLICMIFPGLLCTVVSLASTKSLSAYRWRFFSGAAESSLCADVLLGALCFCAEELGEFLRVLRILGRITPAESERGLGVVWHHVVFYVRICANDSREGDARGTRRPGLGICRNPGVRHLPLRIIHIKTGRSSQDRGQDFSESVASHSSVPHLTLPSVTASASESSSSESSPCLTR